MAEYCSATDVTNRVTDAGVEYCADRDGDGQVGADEITAYVTPAIAYAGREIDFAVCDQFPPATARAQGNGFLKDIAIDLAVERLCSTGTGGIPDSVAAAAERSRALLKQIKMGARIPDFVYPAEPQADPRYPVRPAWPRVVNFGGR